MGGPLKNTGYYRLAHLGKKNLLLYTDAPLFFLFYSHHQHPIAPVAVINTTTINVVTMFIVRCLFMTWIKSIYLDLYD